MSITHIYIVLITNYYHKIIRKKQEKAMIIYITSMVTVFSYVSSFNFHSKTKHKVLFYIHK